MRRVQLLTLLSFVCTLVLLSPLVVYRHRDSLATSSSLRGAAPSLPLSPSAPSLASTPSPPPPPPPSHHSNMPAKDSVGEPHVPLALPRPLAEFPHLILPLSRTTNRGQDCPGQAHRRLLQGETIHPLSSTAREPVRRRAGSARRPSLLLIAVPRLALLPSPTSLRALFSAASDAPSWWRSGAHRAPGPSAPGRGGAPAVSRELGTRARVRPTLPCRCVQLGRWRSRRRRQKPSAGPQEQEPGAQGCALSPKVSSSADHCLYSSPLPPPPLPADVLPVLQAGQEPAQGGRRGL